MGRLRTAIVVALLLVSLALNLRTTLKVKHDESATRATATKTREVQVAGAPVAVCLLKALKAAEPLLLQAPAVERPLQTYVRLQSNRYPGVQCPDRTGP